MVLLSGSSTRAQDFHVDLVGWVEQRLVVLDAVILSLLVYVTGLWLVVLALRVLRMGVAAREAISA
jgi:hypothetical protein